jgi:hypothetical protein
MASKKGITKHLTLDAGKQVKSQVQNIMSKNPVPMADVEHFKITKDKKVRKSE